jgi:hypothetical protein
MLNFMLIQIIMVVQLYGLQIKESEYPFLLSLSCTPKQKNQKQDIASCSEAETPKSTASHQDRKNIDKVVDMNAFIL